MILLDLSNPFTFTVRDQNQNEKELKGTFREYTKEEQINANNKHKALLKKNEEAEKITRSLQRLYRKIDIKLKLEDYEAVDKLDDEISKLEDKAEKLGKGVDLDVYNEGLKERFELCLGGDDKEDILELADRVGYAKVYEKIAEAIQAGKPKKGNA